MSFRFTVPGQPPSVNHAYQVVKGGGRRIIKAKGVEQYQLVAAHMARRAKPTDFQPTGMIRVTYDLHLAHDQDASNCLKSVEDGIAVGLEINDRYMLPCVRLKTIGNAEPWIDVEVEEI